MSSGLLCACERPEHPERRVFSEMPGRCSRYAANQTTGGFCVSCNAGWHTACALPRFPGICDLCQWHGSEHPGR